MTREEALEIVDRLRNWNTSQQSCSRAFGGKRTPEDDIYDARRAALAKAWKVLGEEE
jgi:hypothetical protein